ncbi:MAG: MFS transporter [Pseudomonadota bacterium]
MARVRAALACFLAYAVMSGMLAPLGIISAPLASYLGVDIATATAGFSWLTLGVLGGAVLALWLLSALPLRALLVLVYAAIAGLLLSLALAESATAIGARLALVGVLCGLGLPGAAHVIATTFAAERRTSLLVLTDGAFSMAGVVAGAIASRALAAALPWYQVYLAVAAAAAAAAVLFATLPRPEALRAEAIAAVDASTATDVEAGQAQSWPVAAWWLIAALAAYTLGQSSLLLWLPQHATTLGASLEEGGALVGRYWSGMFAAQIVVALVVLRLGERRLLGAAALGTAAGAALLLTGASADALLWLVPLWGFANLALLKIVIGFSVSVTQVTSPRLISALLLGATTGTACGPALSSAVVRMGGISTALLFGIACLVACATVLLVLLLRSAPRRQRPSPALPD